MKKIFALTSILALCACGGGSGGDGSGYNNGTPDNPDNPNTPNPISNIALSVDNSAETINYAVSRGVVSDGANYETVLQAFQSMYNIGNGTNTTPTTDELRAAYILAGGNADDFNEPTAQSFITSNYTSVLDDYFTPSGATYVWAPQTQTIDDVDFRTGFGDAMQFHITNGKMVSVSLESSADAEMINWIRNGDTNTFSIGTKYRYIVRESVADAIATDIKTQLGEATGHYAFVSGPAYSVLSDEQLSLSSVKTQIKTKIINTLTEMEGEPLSSDIVELIETKINAIADADIGFFKFENAEVELNSFGNEVGLSYSDFGYLKESSDDTFNNQTVFDVSYDVYGGGYDAKSVEKPETEMRFNGSAVARIGVYNANTDEENTLISHTTDANLKITSDGTEKLTMNFSNADNPWYDVVINGQYSGVGGTVAINNTNNVESQIADDFKMTDSMKSNANTYFYTEHNYYGNGTPEEVISRSEFWAPKDENSYLGFQSFFGGKKAE